MNRAVIAGLAALALAGCPNNVSKPVPAKSEPTYQVPMQPSVPERPVLAISLKSRSDGLETEIAINLNESAMQRLAKYDLVWYEINNTGISFQIPKGAYTIKTTLEQPRELDGLMLAIYAMNGREKFVIYSQQLHQGKHGN